MTVRLFLLALLTFSVFASASAQTPPQPSRTSAPTVTVSTASSGVRFVAIGAVRQTRLEVFDASGATVFDSGFQPGNVRDWDARASGLADGTYTCALTARDMSGRLSIKQASALLRAGEASLALGEADAAGETGGAQAAPVMNGHDAGAATLLTHDGRDGALTSTSGALTLRTGDVLTGDEKEHVRVTPEGRIGIGTDRPEAALDVAGAVRASEGLKFADGTTLDAAAGRLTLRDASGKEVPAQGLTAAQATANRLAKFADAAGTLADSGVTEANGNVGVGTAAPASPLTVFSTTNVSPFAVEGAHPIVIGFAVENAAPGSKRWAFQVAGPSHPQGVAAGSFIFRQGTNDINPLVIAPAGNVGVGTDNPQARLHAAGDLRVTGAGSGLVFPDGTKQTTAAAVGGVTGTGTASTVPLWTGTSVLGNSLIKQSGGNVGIDTFGNPQAKLHVAGNVNFVGLRTQDIARGPNVLGGNASNTVTAGVVGATISGGGERTFENDFTNRVTDNFGTVGGGSLNQAGDNTDLTTSASSATVGGGNNNTASGHASTVSGGSSNTASGNHATVPGGAGNVAAGTLSFAAGDGARAMHEGTFVWADRREAFNFFTSSADNQFLVRAAGGVGINTNEPSASLHVAGASAAPDAPVAVIESSGGQAPLNFSSAGTGAARVRADGLGNLILATTTGTSKDIFFRAGDDASTDMLIDAETGRVGVGTTSPARLLTVNGRARVAEIPPEASAGSVCFNAAGDLLQCGASSLRLKTEVESFAGGLGVVKRLRPIAFTWSQGGARDVGLGAEEVARVAPQFTFADEAGVVRGVKYDRLPVLLISAVKEQQRQIEQLRREVAALRRQHARPSRLLRRRAATGAARGVSVGRRTRIEVGSRRRR